MSFRLNVLLAFLSACQIAQAADDVCLHRFKSELVAKPFQVPNQILKVLNISEEMLYTLPQTHKVFTRSTSPNDFSKTNKLSYYYDIQDNGYVISAEYDISSPDESSSEALFSVDQEFWLLGQDAMAFQPCSLRLHATLEFQRESFLDGILMKKA